MSVCYKRLRTESEQSLHLQISRELYWYLQNVGYYLESASCSRRNIAPAGMFMLRTYSIWGRSRQILIILLGSLVVRLGLSSILPLELMVNLQAILVPIIYVFTSYGSSIISTWSCCSKRIGSNRYVHKFLNLQYPISPAAITSLKVASLSSHMSC